MKSFNEWLLLERELDRPMREAAAKTFDKFNKNMMVMLTKGVNDFVNTQASSGRGTETKDIVSHEFAIHGLANSLLDSFRKKLASKTGFMATMSLGQVTLAYNIYDESQIFIPAAINTKEFKSSIADKTLKMMISLEGSARDTGSMLAKGTYHSGKVKKTNPKIEFYDMQHLTLKKDSPLHNFLAEVMKGKFSGKSKQAMLRPANAWLKGIEKELMFLRDIFIHEYMHFLDDIRYKSPSDRPGNIATGINAVWGIGSPPDASKPYYTSDAEWNAYFQGAASDVEDAFASFLVACTNDRARMRALENNSQFDTMNFAAKSKEIAAVVVSDLHRKVKENIMEPWVQDHFKKIGLSGIRMDDIGTLALAVTTWNSYSTSMYFLQDRKKKAKLVNRVMSLRQDIMNIIKEYETRMSQGKTPTVQEFNRAREKFRPGGKPGGNPTKLRSAYDLLYSGLMIGDKVFGPKNKYEGGK